MSAMICGKCSKNHATVHVTEVVGGVKKESHLCEECARAAGGKFTFSITDILANLIEPVKTPGAKTAEPGAPRCPECGISYAEFKAKARLGCANDYEVFKSGLLPLLEKVHGAVQHAGKTRTPSRASSARRPNSPASSASWRASSSPRTSRRPRRSATGSRASNWT